jgi:hypothetical protein
MFNDIRTFIKMNEICSTSLSYPNIEQYSNLKNSDENEDIKNQHYFTEPHICIFSLTS